VNVNKVIDGFVCLSVGFYQTQIMGEQQKLSLLLQNEMQFLETRLATSLIKASIYTHIF
jgi:hypothetical protein